MRRFARVDGPTNITAKYEFCTLTFQPSVSPLWCSFRCELMFLEIRCVGLISRRIECQQLGKAVARARLAVCMGISAFYGFSFTSTRTTYLSFALFGSADEQLMRRFAFWSDISTSDRRISLGFGSWQKFHRENCFSWFREVFSAIFFSDSYKSTLQRCPSVNEALFRCEYICHHFDSFNSASITNHVGEIRWMQCVTCSLMQSRDWLSFL